MTMGKKDDDQSTIKPLAIPEFKSTIPVHMLAKMAEQDRWLSETVSLMEQREKWLVSACTENREKLIEVDTLARTVYNWKQRLTSRWGVVVAIIVLVAPVVVKALLEHWLKP